MNRNRSIAKDYRRRRGVDKRTLQGVWICLLAWLLFACNESSTGGESIFPEAEFGTVVTSARIDNVNSPLDIRTGFTRDDPIIYAVFEVKRLDPGTVLYARWSSEAVDFEEQSASLTADRFYENIYLEFHLEPVQGATLGVLQSGDYQVQLFVNEKAGPKAEFRLE
jgi:hypothetical protein